MQTMDKTVGKVHLPAPHEGLHSGFLAGGKDLVICGLGSLKPNALYAGRGKVLNGL